MQILKIAYTHIKVITSHVVQHSRIYVMRIIVCGAGQVGYSLAAYLSREENDVTVVDHDTNLISKINDNLDVNGIVGNCSSPDVLDAAGASEADLLLAMTHMDEVNMVACQVGHSLFGIPKKIARVRRASYLDPSWSNLFSRAHMPIDLLISPEITVSHDIAQRLSVPGTSLVTSVSDGLLYLLGVTCKENCPILHTPISQLSTLFPDLSFKVLSTVHDGRSMLVRDDTQILAGDMVYLVVDAEHMNRVMDIFGRKELPARRIMIAGGGHVGSTLARILLENSTSNYDITMIDADEECANDLSTEFQNIVVLHGSSLEKHILEEACIRNIDTIISVTDSDETNILTSLLAKQCGCSRAISLVSGSSYTPLIGPLGIDVMVSPRASIVTQIMRHVRRGKIKAIHTLREGFAEVMEVEISQSSPLSGRSIANISLPKQVSIAAVIRKGKTIFNLTNTVIRPEDLVILLVPQGQAQSVEKSLLTHVDLF